MGPVSETPFSGFLQKAARGEGVWESTAQKVVEKRVFFTVFRVRLFLQIQGARSRGSGRFCSELSGARKGVLEDTFPPRNTRDNRVFPTLFPQRDSVYNTHLFLVLSLLGLEGPGQRGRYRAVAPKGLRERAGTGSIEEKSRFLPLLTGTGSYPAPGAQFLTE